MSHLNVCRKRSHKRVRVFKKYVDICNIVILVPLTYIIFCILICSNNIRV